MLVEVATSSGGGLSCGDVVFPDGGVDNDGLIGDLSVGDEVALEGNSGGEGAEKDGSENLRGLHLVGGGCAG